MAAESAPLMTPLVADNRARLKNAIGGGAGSSLSEVTEHPEY